ncbi:MAG: DUF362 domain-containing protein [Planctomycetes bacterium]|nr:DUF362 domain-containing protein [Planctomycetota bacterium]
MRSIVYFVRARENEPRETLAKKTSLLWDKAGFGKLIKKDDFTAIKIHFGEEGGKGYIKPYFVKPVTEAIKGKKGKPFLTDTSTLYAGRRNNAVDHFQMAYEHGFTPENTGCPIIMADGLKGEHQVSVKAKSLFLTYVHLAGLVPFLDVIIGMGHPTGHLLTGYGGALKNLGMGFASRGGKLAQHSGMQPQTITEKCSGCGTCAGWCPSDAILMKNDKMKIDSAKCVGCGECFSVCPEGAIKISWDESSINVQKKMVDYVAEILKGKKSGFMNAALYITKQCDCMGANTGEPMAKDLGLLASLDPIAIDQATIDLVNKDAGEDVFKKHWPNLDYNVQLEYGEGKGVGSRAYEIKEL